MATIRKRIWRTDLGKRRIAWQVDYRDAFNRRKSKQFSSQEEARTWLETTDLRASSTSAKGKTVADATRAWIDRAQANGLERSTVESYEWSRRYIDPYIGSILLAELTQEQVITFRKELASARSPATAERAVHTLKMMLNEAVNAGWVGRNVARRLRSAQSPRHRQAQRKKINVPLRADLRAIIRFLERGVKALREKRECAARERDPVKAKKLEDSRNMAERSRAIFATLFETGMRPSELRGLAWPQVKFGRGAIEVLQRVDKYNAMGDCKTVASYRHIPVPGYVMTFLREWKDLCPPSELDLVFPTAGGNPISLRNLEREFSALQIAAGIDRVMVQPDGTHRRVKRYTLKDCRHGAASWWIHKRINLKDLTTRMGHSSIQVTFDVYGHLIEEAEAGGDAEWDMEDLYP